MVTTSEMGLNQVQEVNAQVANSGDFVRVTFDGRRLDVEGAEIYKFDWAQSLPARSVLYYTMQNPDTLVVRRNLQSNHVMQPSSAVKATEEANSLFEKVLGRKPIYLDVRPRIKSLPLNVLGAKFVTTVDQT